MTQQQSARSELADVLVGSDATLASSISEIMAAALQALIKAELTAKIGAEPGERHPAGTRPSGPLYRLAMDVIHEHVEAALRELADEDEQRRLWRSTAAGGAEVSSFEECVCRIFDDSGLGHEMERSGVVYTQPIDDRLTLLRIALRRIDGRRPPDAVLDDAGLREARALAVDLLRLISDLRNREDGL